MSDSRGNVFLDDRPRSRAPSRAPEAPVSTGDILGAHWTLGRQDALQAPRTAEEDAYSPIVEALRGPRRHAVLDNLLHPNPYFTADAPAGAASMYDTARVWSDVAHRRATDPAFLRDVPATNAAEFSAWVKKRELGARRRAQDVVERQKGAGQNTLGVAADIGAGLLDPINLMTLPLGGAIGGGAKTLAGVVAREALTNAAVEVIELPSIASNRAAFGERMTAGDMATDVGMAGLGGAGFAVGGKLLGAAANAAVGATTRRVIEPLARRLRGGAASSDAEVARQFGEAVSPGVRTPDEQAALHVIQRQADVDAASPFVPTPAGMDAHAETLTAAMERILAAPPAPSPAAVLDAAIGATPTASTVGGGRRAGAPSVAPNLSADRVIGFVMHDLEGGATVVRYGDVDGGTTKYGIAAKFNPGVDVANLTAEQAAAIAKRKYWFPALDRADPRTAAVAFDAGYIGGPKLGERILRESGGDPERALALYRGYLDNLADTNPAKARYRKGWNARVDKLARFVGGSEERVTIRPDAVADGDELALAQRDLDHADMDAQLAASERARADAPEWEPPAGREPIVLEGSGLVETDAPAAPVDARDAADDRASSGPAPLELAPAPEPLNRVDPATQLAVQAYVADRRGSLAPAKMAKALGIAEEDAYAAIGVAAGKQNSGLVVGRDGRVRRAPVRRAPVDLHRFIAENGGIRDSEGHDLAVGRGLRKFVPGVGQMIRKGGKTLDAMREMVAEAGYFHDRSAEEAMGTTTTADFIDLLEQAQHAPHYPMADLHRVAARAEDARLAEERAEIDALVDGPLAEHGFDFDQQQRRRAAALVADGMDADQAIDRVISEDYADAIDMARQQAEEEGHAGDHPSAEYADPGERGYAAPDDDGYGVEVGDPGPRQEDADQYRGASEDDLEAAGLAGPVSTDPAAGRFLDDPNGSGAATIADSLEHDARAVLDRGDAVDPAIAERQRQEAQLKAASPMRAATDQEGTIGAPLSDAADQGGFRLDEEAPERTIDDILGEVDADEAAIKAARDCL